MMLCITPPPPSPSSNPIRAFSIYCLYNLTGILTQNSITLGIWGKEGTLVEHVERAITVAKCSDHCSRYCDL